jgi:hypothetical protein
LSGCRRPTARINRQGRQERFKEFVEFRRIRVRGSFSCSLPEFSPARVDDLAGLGFNTEGTPQALGGVKYNVKPGDQLILGGGRGIYTTNRRRIASVLSVHGMV